VPVHPEFAESLRVARAAGIIGAEVFTSETVRGRSLPMNKEWAAKLKKYAVLVGVNEPKRSCYGVHKARAEVAAYADCTESQMMAMFGWTDPKMRALHRAGQSREAWIEIIHKTISTRGANLFPGCPAAAEHPAGSG
jgi:hypothetical protein